MSSLKFELKQLEINVKSCHFETGFKEEDFGSQNDTFPPAVTVTCN